MHVEDVKGRVMETFGQIVREIRKREGMSLTTLARKVNKSIAYLSQIENPKSGTPPSEDVGDLIIKALPLKAGEHSKLEEALIRTIREHKAERAYDSSLFLEDFFRRAGMSVQQV